MSEQRRTKRFQLNLPVELVKSGSIPVHLTGETHNMSSGGVLFTSQSLMEIGEPIEYLVTLPSTVSAGTQVRIRCMGKVTRAESRENAELISERPYSIAATLERYEFIRNKTN